MQITEEEKLQEQALNDSSVSPGLDSNGSLERTNSESMLELENKVRGQLEKRQRNMAVLSSFPRGMKTSASVILNECQRKLTGKKNQKFFEKITMATTFERKTGSVQVVTLKTEKLPATEIN